MWVIYGPKTLRHLPRVSVSGEMTCKASIMKGERVKGKAVQTTVAYLGRVEEDQIPYLKAAYAKKRPGLVWDDEESSQDVGPEQQEIPLLFTPNILGPMGTAFSMHMQEFELIEGRMSAAKN